MGNGNNRTLFILLMDVGISIIASLLSVILVRFLMDAIPNFQTFLFTWVGWSGICTLLGILIMGSNKIIIRYSTLRSLGRIMFASILKIFFMVPLMIYIYHHFYIHTHSLLILLGVIDFLMTLVALILTRVGLIIVMDDFKQDLGRDVDRIKVLVYGTGVKSVSLVTRMDDSPRFMVVGYLTTDNELAGHVLHSKKVFSFTNSTDLAKLQDELGFEGLLLHKSIEDNCLTERELNMFIENGIHILTVPQVSEVTFNGFNLGNIKAINKKDDFIPDGMSNFERVLKRFCDFILSGILLIVFSPAFFFCWLAIKIEDGGPAIFSQERIGRFGRPFNIYKFRSMRIDAEKMGPALYSGEDDPRLTKVGKFLRSHHLDELPQLWNVFLGNMAFIGYRPERQFYIDQILEQDPRYFYLYQIRPGVTSYATLRNGYTDTMDKMLRRLELDLYYLRNRSTWLDLKILFETFCSIIFGKKF
ncbi:MAG: exopolysaccharide biosynthesis polyprenyl glycosylphosphotransferase [Bacteroidales bacterium]|nr:exopolysaccharide biosynthesis polyprenyl glycosylphosphotransferase [Bacteroidales bacterium]